MEKYVKAQMEVIEFEAEDVITTSTGCETVSLPIGCSTDSPPKPDDSGTIWGD